MQHKRLQRNSSIELLRILAMFMILAHHFAVHNATLLINFPPSISRFCYQFFIESFGKIGVVIFFMISAWFFADKDQNVKTCLRRIWIFDREVLFWSYILLTFFVITNRSQVSTSYAIKCLFPLISGIWWYATAYALFLAFLPVLHKALRAIGRTLHLQLAVIMLVIYGILAIWPPALKAGDSVYTFIYLYVLMTAYKWYFKPFKTKTIIIILVLGIAIILLFVGLSNISSLLGHSVKPYITSTMQLPIILVGTSLFLLFERISFRNFIIDKIAQSTFAVYLITDFKITSGLLWNKDLDLQNIFYLPFSMARVILALIIIYLACTVLDFIRQGFFAITVNRHPGKWFNALWNWSEKHITKAQWYKTLQNSLCNSSTSEDTHI